MEEDKRSLYPWQLDELSVREIKQLVFDGVIELSYVEWYYNNQWWDETP